MAVSTTLAELLAKLPTHVGATPRSGAVLEDSASAPVEYMDRAIFQFHVTEPRIDGEVLINQSVVTDLDPELVQSQTIQAGAVSFTAEEILALPSAQTFFQALKDAAFVKLTAQRAALEDPAPATMAPALEPPPGPGPVFPPPFPA